MLGLLMVGMWTRCLRWLVRCIWRGRCRSRLVGRGLFVRVVELFGSHNAVTCLSGLPKLVL